MARAVNAPAPRRPTRSTLPSASCRQPSPRRHPAYSKRRRRTARAAGSRQRSRPLGSKSRSTLRSPGSAARRPACRRPPAQSRCGRTAARAPRLPRTCSTRALRRSCSRQSTCPRRGSQMQRPSTCADGSERDREETCTRNAALLSSNYVDVPSPSKRSSFFCH